LIESETSGGQEIESRKRQNQVRNHPWLARRHAQSITHASADKDEADDSKLG